MNIFKATVSVIIIALVVIFFLSFKSEIFIFLENLRMAFWGTFNKDLSYRSLLEYKLNNFYNSPSNNTNNKGNVGESFFSENGLNYFKAKIFSNYPFNDYSKIVIEGGKDVNLMPGMPVLVSKNFLLGKIVEVREKTSLVETFFDPEWKSSVIIGEENVKGLLEGGTNPLVNFVLEEKKVASSSLIYNVDSKFPWGLKIGNTEERKIKNNWQTFSVSVPYDLNSLSELLVITNFK